ncbi:MAG TPA: hypothetical protein VMD03_05180 [Steroidobacteraceae bacterium]|nr:hypothetical protein [Steroidobacteraceae bacterium]
MVIWRAIKKNGLGLALLCGALTALPIAARADIAGEVMAAATHAGLSAHATTVAMAHTHLHHTLNCLVGPGGRGFDSKELNPCNGLGNGAIPDATDSAQKKMLERIAARTRAALKSEDLATVTKDAQRIQSELQGIKG